MWVRSAVGAINELESRGLPPRGTRTSAQWLALAGVASEFSSLLGRLVCQGLNHGWHRWSASRSLCGCGRHRLIFETGEANHHFAPPPYAPIAGQSEFVITSAATAHCTC